MSLELFSCEWPIVRFDCIDSTNEEARRRAASGDLGPCWIVANEQTKGRGRLGRQWASPGGNLYATALLAFPGSLQTAALSCFSAGLAVLDASSAVGIEAGQLRLKWPNDVLVDGAKLSGILTETGSEYGKLWMAAGFGVNVAMAPWHADRATACLAELAGGEQVRPLAFLRELDIAFRARLAQLLGDGFSAVRADWLAHAAHLSAQVALTRPAGSIEGVMTGLAMDGALVIRHSDGTESHVRAGEISVLS